MASLHASHPNLSPSDPTSHGGLFAMWIVIVVAFAFLLVPTWVWFWWRIEPGPEEVAVLIHKTGKDLPTGELLALQPSQKGIQLDVLPPGRYFRNPYSWGWEMARVTDVPAGKLAVLIRLYGANLPPGLIIAEKGQKGIVADVLRPGKYFVNPYAYSVHMFDAITIRPGAVGVITSLTGKDPLSDQLPDDKRNAFIVNGDMKGVKTDVLDPGTYYLNPYVVNVVEVNLQSQKFQLSGDDSISFLTLDGFMVTVEGTIEFALAREKAALLTHQVGDIEDILKKIVLPRARGFSRIEGSKNPATSYIVGETRQMFQENLQVHLQTTCEEWGVSIKSVLIRNITPPDQIASVIRDREVAVQNAKKFDQQTEQARSQAELTKQEMLAVQNKERVAAETFQIKAVILAEQEREVRMTGAEKELAVAKLENEAATAQAEAVRSKAKGDQEVVRLNNEAEAGVLGGQMQAFGTGMNVARYALYQRIGPRIRSILSTDQSDGLGGLFLPYLSAGRAEGKGVQP